MQTPADDLDAFIDAPTVARIGWLTHRRIIFFVIGWLSLFALLSALLSNPFRSESSASATPNYWHVMFLHALLIGTVALGALLACQVLRLRSMHVRVWIALGALAATIPVAIGGIFDRHVPGDELAVWIQVAGFFALDEIFVVLLAGIVAEWRRGSSATRTLAYLAAGIATASMLAAAVMGHLAGWILEYGNTPALIGRYAHFIGTTTTAWKDALVGSHSHEMVVAMMAFVVALAAQQFDYQSLTGASRLLARIGLAAVAIGTVAMSGMYLAAGFSTWAPPAWFTSAGATNGVASDDVVTGIFVMGGGLLVLLAYALVGTGAAASLRRRPLRVAAAWSWVLSFATVVIAGYSIELDETHFGAGDPKAAGAANDAVFTWLHQDIGLFLLPTLVLLMLVAERLIVPRCQGAIGWLAAVGSTVTFVGGLVFVFVNPALHGPGYAITTAGLGIVGAAVLATMWWGTLGARRPGGGGDVLTTAPVSGELSS